MSNYPSEPTPDAMPDPAGLEPEPAAEATTGTAGEVPAGARPEPALGPLYALAGLTDLLAASVRKTIADSAEEANRRRAEAQARLNERTKAGSGDASAEELARLLAALPTQLRALPELARARALVLQHLASSRYNELSGRGRKAVDGAVTSAKGLTARAEQRAGVVRTEVVERIDPTLDRVQEKVAAARRAAAGDAKSPVYEPSNGTSATTGTAGTEPVTPTSGGPAAEEFPAVDEVIITPVSHGDEVPPPTFDAPASDVPPSTGDPSSSSDR